MLKKISFLGAYSSGVRALFSHNRGLWFKSGYAQTIDKFLDNAMITHTK